VRGEQTRARVAPHLDARARLRTEKQTCDMLGAVREGHARKRPCDDAEFEGEGGAKHRHDARARKAPDSPAPAPSASAILQVYSSACSDQEVELVRAHLRRVLKRDVNVVSVNVIGDGNCFPRALLVAASPDDVTMAHDEGRQTEAVRDLRELAAKYVEKTQQFAADAFAAENELAGSLEEGDAGTPMRSRDDLARSLRKNGTYTGQLGIEAFAQAKNWSVSVYQLNEGRESIAASVTATTLGPKPEKADRLVAVGYKPGGEAGGHYWAYAVTEAQADETLVGELTTEAKMATAPAAGERVEHGMTTTYVARGGEDTSGVARATGETPRETARKTKQNEKKMKMCALCKSAQGAHSISNWYCGQTFDTIFGPALFQLTRKKQDQIGTIDPNLVICEGDMVCGSCASFSTFVVRDRSDCAYENRTEDARKVVIFATHVLEKCGGELPRTNDVAALAGWEREDADMAQVAVGAWWYDFSIKNDGDRKKRVAESARDEATKKALQYLAQCEKRDKENARRDVEGDSRRVCIFATHVLKKCGGQLPRKGDVAELAGWEHEDADLAQVKVGDWWYEFFMMNDGARKKRVEESARDEATQDALQYLAQCPIRDHGKRDVEGDSRRVRILAKYVREELDGQLPRDKDVAALAGWAREDAGVARVPVGQWLYDFSSKNDGARKKRVEESARDEETQKALRYLAQCEKRDKDTRCDVEGDSRRVRMFAKYVREECGGQLPRDTDVAELAGWEREGAVKAQVKVGKWWWSFSRHNGGERKKRVEESARDEATQDALQYLAQCEVRDHGKCDVEGDSRRVRILAKYVREELDGQLPRDKDVAALAGWKREGAGVAQVKVGDWWRNFSSRNDGARKKRVEESAPDEETKKALRYLAQCPMRDSKRLKRRRN